MTHFLQTTPLQQLTMQGSYTCGEEQSQAGTREATQAEEQLPLLAKASSRYFPQKAAGSTPCFVQHHIFPRITTFKSPSTLVQRS